MNLSVIFHGDWEVYAHRDPVSGKRELLQEHIVRCEKYRIRISQERKLLKIEENFLTKLGLDKDDFAGKLVKEMIDAVILFPEIYSASLSVRAELCNGRTQYRAVK